MSADWSDPAYVAARRVWAAAYAEFCRVAGANPHRWGEPEHRDYYDREVLPVKAVWIKAAADYRAEEMRVMAGGETS